MSWSLGMTTQADAKLIGGHYSAQASMKLRGPSDILKGSNIRHKSISLTAAAIPNVSHGATKRTDGLLPSYQATKLPSLIELARVTGHCEIKTLEGY